MAINKEAYLRIKAECEASGVTLVAVSKIQPNEKIMALYQMGQRDFGENYVQELVAKYEALPKDIRWHFIGHLQSNKVKYIAPFVHLVHGVDSEKLLAAIDKEAKKAGRVIDCLLQLHIAREETKFGMDEEQLANVEMSKFANARVCGLMGMGSFSDDENTVRNEFKMLKNIFDKYQPTPDQDSPLKVLSMGMSGDYKIAIEEGSTMVRIGSLLFGARL
ncbi:MAG: YggS family pyridoxal phosphate-dependent enzyme [Bacteroidota bacterium]